MEAAVPPYRDCTVAAVPPYRDCTVAAVFPYRDWYRESSGLCDEEEGGSKLEEYCDEDSRGLEYWLMEAVGRIELEY